MFFAKRILKMGIYLIGGVEINYFNLDLIRKPKEGQLFKAFS